MSRNYMFLVEKHKKFIWWKNVFTVAAIFLMVITLVIIYAVERPMWFVIPSLVFLSIIFGCISWQIGKKADFLYGKINAGG